MNRKNSYVKVYTCQTINLDQIRLQHQQTSFDYGLQETVWERTSATSSTYNKNQDKNNRKLSQLSNDFVGFVSFDMHGYHQNNAVNFVQSTMRQWNYNRRQFSIEFIVG